MQGNGERQVKGVVGSLVLHNSFIVFHGELRYVAVRVELVQGLPAGGNVGDFVEELHQRHIAVQVAEMLLQNGVHSVLDHEGIVNGSETHALDFVPAQLTAPGGAIVHHIVRDNEETLELQVEREPKWNGGPLDQRRPKTLTISTHQPRYWASFMFSGVRSCAGTKFLYVRTVRMPRFFFPLGTLYWRTWANHLAASLQLYAFVTLVMSRTRSVNKVGID